MSTLEGIIDSLENLEVKRALAVKMFLLDFHGCGFSSCSLSAGRLPIGPC
jgi:hypothetical protein